MYSIVRMGVAALIIATITVWSTAQASDSVVGSWRLVSWVQEDLSRKTLKAKLYRRSLAIIQWE